VGREVASEVKAMELKKQDSLDRDKKNGQAAAAKKFKAREWIEEIKHEIKTINWTTPEELRVYTQIVVGATFFFGMGVYLVDLVIHGALNILTAISRLLVG
jgi:preprotein translocase subunit SecE